MNKRYLIEQAKEVSEYYRVKSHEKPGLTEAEKKAWWVIIGLVEYIQNAKRKEQQ